MERYYFSCSKFSHPSYSLITFSPLVSHAFSFISTLFLFFFFPVTAHYPYVVNIFPVIHLHPDSLITYSPVLCIIILNFLPGIVSWGTNPRPPVIVLLLFFLLISINKVVLCLPERVGIEISLRWCREESRCQHRLLGCNTFHRWLECRLHGVLFFRSWWEWTEQKISEIKGEHYCLSQKGWTEILSFYEFSMIPTYIIYDKREVLRYKPTLFMGVKNINLWINNLLNKE